MQDKALVADQIQVQPGVLVPGEGLCKSAGGMSGGDGHEQKIVVNRENFQLFLLKKAVGQNQVQIPVQEPLLHFTAVDLRDGHLDIGILLREPCQHTGQQVAAPAQVKSQAQTAAVPLEQIVQLPLELILNG